VQFLTWDCHACLFETIEDYFWFYDYCRKHEVYQCGDLEKFIETVVEKVESLPAAKIAEALNGFLQQ